MRKIVKYKGITILYESHHKNKASDVEFGIFTGSDLDGKKMGLAHMFEHSLFFSTKNRTTEDLSSFRSMHAASSSAYTSQFVTAMTFYESSKALDKILSVLSDHFFNSLPTEEELAKEKKIVIEELIRAKQNDGRKIHNTYLNMILDKKRQFLSSLGTEDTIKSFSIKDLKAYRKKWYKRQNFFFSICTNVSLFKIKRLVNKYFIPFLDDEPSFKPIFLVSTSNTKSAIKTISKQGKPLCTIKVMKMLDVNYSLENSVRCSVVENSLNIPQNRMFQTFREKHGLTYEYPSISTILSNKYGYLSFDVRVGAKNIKKALDLASELFADLNNNGITEDEFKTYQLLRERQKDVSLISPVKGEAGSNLRTYYARQKFVGNRPFRKYRNSLKYKDVNEYSKQLFNPNKIYVLIFGEFDKKDIYSLSKIKKLFNIPSETK